MFAHDTSKKLISTIVCPKSEAPKIQKIYGWKNFDILSVETSICPTKNGKRFDALNFFILL